MKMKLYLGALILTTGLLSCKKDSEFTVTNVIGPDLNWYADNEITTSMKAVELTNELQTTMDTVSFDLTPNNSTPLIVPCGNNVKFTFYPSSIIYANLPFYGKVHLNYRIITTKGNQIRLLKNSKTDNGQLVENYVTLFFELKNNNNQDLFIDDNIPVIIDYERSGNNNSSSSSNLYSLTTNGFLSYLWSIEPNNSGNTVTISNDDISFSLTRTGWFNCGKVYSPSNQNKVAIKLPENYTNANTIAYVVSITKNIALQLDPSVTNKQFQSINLNIGGVYKLVVLSKQANSYFMATQDITVSSTPTPGYPFQIVNVTPTLTNMTNIENLLSQLQ